MLTFDVGFCLRLPLGLSAVTAAPSFCMWFGFSHSSLTGFQEGESQERARKGPYYLVLHLSNEALTKFHPGPRKSNID